MQARTVGSPWRPSSSSTRSAAFRHVPTMAWKSPSRSRGIRMFAKSTSRTAWLGTPRSTTRMGGMRTPSW